MCLNVLFFQHFNYLINFITLIIFKNKTLNVHEYDSNFLWLKIPNAILVTIFQVKI